VYVFGSQAILCQFPDAPPELRQSAEADVAPKNHPERADQIDAMLGELSMFHSTHGFYVHGLSIETATLPSGWEARTHVIQNANTRDNRGICVEAHDLAASKLVAFREKDRMFVRTLLAERMIEAEKLKRVLGLLPIADGDRERLVSWVELTALDE
jgi:hypothetical protein